LSVFVLDASTAAAWLLPEEHSETAEQLIASISGQCPVPGLFWHEARSILVTAERRQRIAAGQALTAMTRLRRLPLEDAGAGQDGSVIELATVQGLSAYDAAYLELAIAPITSVGDPRSKAGGCSAGRESAGPGAVRQ